MMGVCRYCGCTENTPCLVVLDLAGSRLTRACDWLLPDVCDAPACVERAYNDARNLPEVLDRLLAEGERIEVDEPGEAA